MAMWCDAIRSIEPEDDLLGHQRRPLLAFHLDHAVEADAEAVLDGFHAFYALFEAHARAAGHRAGEAQLVEAVVQGARTLRHRPDLRRHERHDGQHQVAVRNGFAAGRLALAAFHVHVDPLVVAGELGVFVDERLIHGAPLAYPQVFAGVVLEIRRVLDDLHVRSFFGFFPPRLLPTATGRPESGRAVVGYTALAESQNNQGCRWETRKVKRGPWGHWRACACSTSAACCRGP